MATKYVISLDTMRVIEANSETEALTVARQEFIQMLQQGDGEFYIDEEFDDDVEPSAAQPF